MSESPQLLRQWKILQLLESSRTGYTVDDLVRETDVSEKTIRRDLNVLRSIFHVYAETATHGVKRWKMKPLADKLQLRLTDLISIAMGRRFLEPLAGTPFWDGMQNVQRQIRAVLGTAGEQYLEKLASFLQTSRFGQSDYSKRGRIIDALILAMEERRRVLAVYQSQQSTEPVEQELGPLGFVWHNGSLYLVAWSARRREVRHYKLDRIQHVELAGDLKYVVPENFCLQTWQREAFGIWRSSDDTASHFVRIHFTREAARYVREGFWHETQQLHDQPDGSVILTMQVTDLTPVISWILSFGPTARALEPPELLDRLSEQLNAMTRLYDSPVTSHPP